MYIDMSEIEPRQRYKLIIGAVVPRPIAWISTISKSGTANLAPFSFYNAFSATPPVIGVGIGSRQISTDDHSILTVPKDTYLNMRETGEFVVNVVSKTLAEKMVTTSGDYPPDECEFDAAGLEMSPSKIVRCPRVSEALVSMECGLMQVIELGNTNLVLGSIVAMHIDDSVYTGESIDIESLQPVGRLGGDLYCNVESTYAMKRPGIGTNALKSKALQPEMEIDKT